MGILNTNPELVRVVEETLQGSLYCHPKQCTINGNPFKITIRLLCLTLPKPGNFMIPAFVSECTWWIWINYFHHYKAIYMGYNPVSHVFSAIYIWVITQFLTSRGPPCSWCQRNSERQHSLQFEPNIQLVSFRVSCAIGCRGNSKSWKRQMPRRHRRKRSR